MFFKTGVLKNLGKFIGKHLCWCLFLKMLQALRAAILLKRDSNTGVILRLLLNFLNTFFYRIPAAAAFYHQPFNSWQQENR